MQKRIVQLKMSHVKNSSIKLPQHLYTSLKEYTQLSFGAKTVECAVSAHLHEEEVVYISSDVWENLLIPHEGNIHIMTSDSSIHIGPLVGIFTAGFTGSLLRPVGDRSMFFAKLLEADKHVGTFSFLFGGHQINWEAGTVTGYFHSKNGWKQCELPFPNVVYDRLPNRKTENLTTLQEIKEKLTREYLIPWFNPGFFNKWEIHNILTKIDEVHAHLPETVFAPTASVIRSFIEKYHQVYLKPSNGSLGLGIYQIIYAPTEDTFYCRFRKDDKNFLRKYNSLDTLLTHLFPENELEKCIAQQGISLLRFNHKQVDLRVHTNKNENGNWEMSAAAVKVAGAGSVTTHLRSGGEVKTVEELFENEQERARLLQQLEKLTIKISTILDEKINGLIGEIGFDIGIDKNHHIWLFEANSKPGRSIFKHPELKETDHYSRQLPMSYAVFLAEKSIKQPDLLYK